MLSRPLLLWVTLPLYTVAESISEHPPHFTTPLMPALLTLVILYGLIVTFLWLHERRVRQRRLMEHERESAVLQKELAAANERISRANTLIGLGFWEIDKKREHLTISPEVSELWGFSTVKCALRFDELPEEIPYPLQRLLMAAIDKAPKDTNPANLIHKVIHPQSGKITVVNPHWVHHYDEAGNYEGTKGIIINITRQHLHEQAIEKAEAQLRSIINGIDAHIYLKDISGRFQMANRAFIKQYCLSDTTLVGKTASDVFPREEARKNTQRDSRVLLRGETVSYEETRGTGKEKQFFLTTKFPLFGKKEVITGLVAMSVNITQQKALESALIKARDDAEIAFRSKSEFLANMSHEIRTPLNAVTGFSELLQDIVEDEQQKKYLTAIKAAGKTLLTIINEILDLSKLEAGKVSLTQVASSLPTIFNELEQLFGIKAQDKGLKLTFFVSNRIPTCIDIDPDHLKQILLNLIGNALKFTERGAIVVSAEQSVDEESLIITVKDTGIGIEAGSIETIFEDFQQQAGQDSRTYGGTGLGLSISRRLVSLMGGEIFVSSTPGAGTTFTVTLPLVVSADQTVSSHTPEQIPAVTFSGEKVWIAEDSDSNRVLLEEALSLVNITPRGFSTATALLDALDEDAPQLILTDFQMPGMSGFDLLQKCKVRDRCKDIPIILLTTLDNLEEFHYFTGKGFDHCLQKPIEIDQLYKLLAQYLTAIEQVPSSEKEESVSYPPLPPAIITYLEDHFLKRIKALQGAINVEELKYITQELQNRIKTKEFPQLSHFMDDIFHNIQQFDVMAIRNLPVKTEQFIMQCKGDTHE